MKKHFVTFLLVACSLIGTRPAVASLPYQPIEFPRDEGGHFDNTPYAAPFLMEWWYFNGEVESLRGDSLSYYVALFEEKVPSPDGTSIEKYSAHMHITNLDEQIQIPGGAGFTPDTVSVSTADLDINYDDDFIIKRIRLPFTDESIYVLYAAAMDYSGTSEIEIALVLHPETAPLLVGGDGLVDMPDGGDSYYYTFTRMHTVGFVRIGDKYYPVNPKKSTSWMDHQWGDFFPADHGWEWFSVRLDNGLDGNVFVNFLNETREVVGGWASFVLPDGSHRHIELDSTFDLGRDDFYTSPFSGETYPMHHRLVFPEIDLELDLDALFPEQDRAIWIWEGYNDVDALFEGNSTQGFAYMEILYPQFIAP
jgi:predicted secreted hydrolase